MGFTADSAPPPSSGVQPPPQPAALPVLLPALRVLLPAPPVLLPAPPVRVLAAMLALSLALVLSGCNLNYYEGKLRESQNRWEEAAIQYHLAVIKDPGDDDFRAAYDRAIRQTARENMERYKEYLANKEFTKAYNRLVDAARQDPSLEAATAEQAKWLRVLVAGQINFDFKSLQANTHLADEIRLTVRINTPNPGEVIETEIDVDSGVFFVENLLYDRPNELLTYYTLNAIGVTLVQGKTRSKQFSSKDFVRMVNFRVPALESPPQSLSFQGDGKLESVADQRRALAPDRWDPQAWAPPVAPRFQVAVEGNRIRVQTPYGRSDFTPRFLYVNRKDRRIFVDFGRYSVRQDEGTRRWGLTRQSLTDNDYFPQFSRNVALQPYFYYRDGVLAYEQGK